jgi:hypothetical protein
MNSGAVSERQPDWIKRRHDMMGAASYPPEPGPPKGGVGDETKYEAACHETVARLEARDSVIEKFVLLTAAIVALSLTKSEYALFGVAVGYTALAAALLSRHHDVIIGLLGMFQHNLCANDPVATNWFSDCYFHDVLKERGYRDVSLALVLAGGGVFGLGVAWKTVYMSRCGEPKTIIWYSSLASLIASLFIVYWTHQTREELHRRTHPYHKE